MGRMLLTDSAQLASFHNLGLPAKGWRCPHPSISNQENALEVPAKPKETDFLVGKKQKGSFLPWVNFLFYSAGFTETFRVEMRKALWPMILSIALSEWDILLDTERKSKIGGTRGVSM